MIECPMCGYRFDEPEAAASCRGCPLARGCALMRCPRCGYEIMREPGLVRAFKNWRKKRGSGRKSTGNT